jgi:hypothetical protein
MDDNELIITALITFYFLSNSLDQILFLEKQTKIIQFKYDKYIYINREEKFMLFCFMKGC